jgi:hypothetical protein
MERAMPPELSNTVLGAHRQLAIMGVYYMFLCGVWGLIMTWRKQSMDGNYRGILAIGYLLGLVIGVMGGLLYLFTPLKPGDPLHVLYGLVTAIGIPGAGAYFQKAPDERKPLIYAIASFFIFGVMIRGILTATR